MEDVRTFCFIAHVDHGKSSLSSRLLEITGNLGLEAQKSAWNIALEQERHGKIEYSDDNDHSSSSSSKNNNESNGNETIQQIQSISSGKEHIEMLDTLAVEQQRGITVKASTATMLYPHLSAVGPEKTLLLNIFDSPGHVDFGREVSRSLCFVQGAILLLDASQGIQAQTWSVYEKAKALPKPPTVLIALTKIDLPAARPIHVSLSVSEWLDFDPDEIVMTSARNRVGVKPLLDLICERIPHPEPLADDTNDANAVLRAQVVDSWYDSRGVNCLVQISSGTLSESDRISIHGLQQSTSYSVQEVGILLPKQHRTGELRRGQMGYVRFGLRDPRQAMPGTILIWTSHVGKKDLLLPQAPFDIGSKSVLYASVHPIEEEGFEDLCSAVDRLALNDTGLEVTKTSSAGRGTSSGPFLGPGLRVGYVIYCCFVSEILIWTHLGAYL
jgi:translation elongation factor EF-4